MGPKTDFAFKFDLGSLGFLIHLLFKDNAPLLALRYAE